MDEVGKLLPGVFHKQIRRTEPHVLDILIPLWPRIAGKTLAQHSQPAHFEAGSLTLNADCPTWGKQLRYMTEEIRTGINGYMGLPIVKKVRIKTVAPRGWAPLPKSGPAKLLASPVRPAAKFDGIADPEVAAMLASSYAKYFSRRGR